MDVKALTHKQLVNEHYYYCKDSVGYGEPIETPTGIELLRRLTPQVSGDVGELLDKELSRIDMVNDDKDNPIQVRAMACSFGATLSTLRQAITDLQADRERLEWLIKNNHRFRMQFNGDRWQWSIAGTGQTWYARAPRAAIDAAMKEDKSDESNTSS